jgi:hypothetical protein
MRDTSTHPIGLGSADLKPLVLLDVDGVVNDLASLYGRRRPWNVDRVASNGFEVHVPSYMPELIRQLARVTEVQWCTTWRHKANDEIAAHLGVGPLPVVDDGTSRRVTSWKAAAAYDTAEEALKAGRRVIWIEDFYGDPPIQEMPEGTEFIDTANDPANPVLVPEMIAHLLLGSEAA